ncbi:hypothetical protein AQ708_04220 [Burkholderia pseudomallei]|nr:hypothetical protein AQ708_04220 [Burkholderia pseudomallei]
MAIAVDCAQVLWIVGAATSLRNDMVDFVSHAHSPESLALRTATDASITQQNEGSQPLPIRTVSTLMAIAAYRVRLPIRVIFLMRRAVRSPTWHEFVTPAMLAWTHRTAWHQSNSFAEYIAKLAVAPIRAARRTYWPQ